VNLFDPYKIRGRDAESKRIDCTKSTRLREGESKGVTKRCSLYKRDGIIKGVAKCFLTMFKIGEK